MVSLHVLLASVPGFAFAADKQIAATALLYDLIPVTRNIRHFASTGVKLLDPFTS